jgi:magnesium transporter
MDCEPIQVIEFDFSNRRDRPIAVDQIVDAISKGLCCWLDIDISNYSQTAKVLEGLGVNSMVIEEALSNEVTGRHAIHEDCLHIYVTAPQLKARDLEFARVDMILGTQIIITLHRGHVEFLQRARLDYAHFFHQHALTLGFLLFEFWDKLIDHYRKSYLWLENEVENVQASIFTRQDETIYSRVSEITRDLLTLRRNVIADRESLQHLSIRKTEFVSETTQPYLAKMVGTLDRLGSDVAVEREILNDTLTLYLAIVTQRTNRVVNHLTVISVIFLPLTFLVGLYGMNFVNQPEVKWSFGYQYFWILSGGGCHRKYFIGSRETLVLKQRQQ